MRHVITTKHDLRNWVNDMTNGWGERSPEDVDVLTDTIQAMDHPSWGRDWSDWLGQLPELTELLPVEETHAS